MAKKRKKKYKTKEYDEYEDEDEEEESWDDEEDTEDEEEEDDDLPAVKTALSRVRSLGKFGKSGKKGSSFVRVKARSPQHQETRPVVHRRERDRRGPHFSVTKKPGNYSSQSFAGRNSTHQTHPSVFIAWGKLLVLLLVLVAGTWLAFSLSGEGVSVQKSRPDQKNGDWNGGKFDENFDENIDIPTEIAQFPQTLSQNLKLPLQKQIGDSRLIDETSKIIDLTLPENVGLLKKELEAISPMVRLPEGKFQMGDDGGICSDQRPAHSVTLPPFLMDAHPVTNRQFQIFVTANSYKTTAERRGWSYVFDFEAKKWVKMEKAFWKSPRGHDTWNDNIWDHPVTHVSWDDAVAFCAWAGKQLPTEAQWEYAARGGLVDQVYPWGKQREIGGKWMANYWQGWFPDENTLADGFLLTSPVQSFPVNPFGLYDMGGNAWEWCHDWYDDGYYSISATESPQGPTSGSDRLVRGGSFLSAENRDAGYRVAVRSFQPQTATYQDVGFRCVRMF